MPGINAFMRKAAKEGVTDLRGALFDVVEEMKSAGSSADALNIATKAFGAEGAQRLVTAVDNGVFALDDLVGALENSGGAIAENEEATRTNTERLKLMRQEISEKLAGAWGSLPAPIQLTAGALGGVMGAIGPLLVALPGMIALMNGMKVATIAKTVATKAATVAQWLINAAMSANPIGILIIALAALGAAIYLLIDNWDLVKRKTIEVWDKFKDFLMGIWEKVKANIELIMAAILLVIFPPAGLAILIHKFWGPIKGAVGQVFKGVYNVVKAWIRKIIAAIAAVPRAIKNAATSLPGVGAVTGAVGKIKGIFNAEGGIAMSPSLGL